MATLLAAPLCIALLLVLPFLIWDRHLRWLHASELWSHVDSLGPIASAGPKAVVAGPCLARRVADAFLAAAVPIGGHVHARLGLGRAAGLGYVEGRRGARGGGVSFHETVKVTPFWLAVAEIVDAKKMPDGLIEEMGLLYVGVARARKAVYVYASMQRRTKYGNYQVACPSCLTFLPGIEPVSWTVMDGEG